MRRVFFICLFFLIPASAMGQAEDESAIPAIQELLATPPLNDLAQEQDPFGLILPRGFELDDATHASIQEAVRGFYDYRTEAFKHRLRVFWWQQVSTQIIFVVVILIVAVGLYFSWLQFHATKDRSKTDVTTLEAGTSGFKITSPVLGVIILALSLAFFYLYLVHVYPISDAF